MKFPLLVLLACALLPLSGRATDASQARLEGLLAQNPQAAFPMGKGAREISGFDGPFDVAYRLMRIYAVQGEWQKMEALALRIARGEEPFDMFRRDALRGKDVAGLEFGNAALALAVAQAPDAASLRGLKEALQGTVWVGALSQVDRRMAPPAGRTSPAVPWANVRAGATLLVSDENVLSLAHDGRFVFSGHPWGVGIWDFSGKLVTRVALAAAAEKLVVAGGAVWAATPAGLFRISRPDGGDSEAPWKVERQVLFAPLSSGRSEREIVKVCSLAVDGRELWIGTSRDVQVLNLKTRELRSFSYDEMKLAHGGSFDRVVPDGPYVWAETGRGIRRYDRATGEWSVLPEDIPGKEVRLVGIADGKVFGAVDFRDEERIRLCEIDRKTLRLTMLPLIEDERRARGAFSDNQPLKRIYETPRSVVKIPRGFLFGYDVLWIPKENHLRSLQDELVNLRQSSGEVWRENPDDPLSVARLALQQKALTEKHLGAWPSGDWFVLPLPDQGLALGCRRKQVEGDRRSEITGTVPEEIRSDKGGLYFVTGTAAPRRVSASAATGGLPGDTVFGVVFDGPAEQTWILTDGGVALWDGVGGIAESFGRSQGLLSNTVGSGVRFGDDFYFSAAWGDSGGGLIRYDPRSRVFTSYLASDGLATGKVLSVEADGDKLKLSYGFEYLRYVQTKFRYRRHPTGWFDPATGNVVAGGEPVLLEELPRPDYRSEPLPELPALGGGILGQREHAGKTFLFGTRGLAVQPMGGELQLTISDFGAKPVAGTREAWLADVRKRPVQVSTPAELQAALRDVNPLYRAEAVASIKPVTADFLKQLGRALGDRDTRVRSTALCQLYRADGVRKESAPLLRGVLKDKDPALRALAVQGLCLAGEPPPAADLLPILNSQSGHFEYPYGAEQRTAQIHVSKDSLCEAVAPHADARVFSALVQDPPRWGDYENSRKVFPALGEALRRHPDALPVVLGNRVMPDYLNDKDFPMSVLLSAGKEMMPRVHDSLASTNWIERRNAARVCGAMGDQDSIPALRQALQKEESWPQEHMVRALGALHATEALPDVIAGYWRFREISDGRLEEWMLPQAVIVSQTPIPRRRLAGRRTEEDSRVMSAYYDCVAALGTSAGREFFLSLKGDQDADARGAAARYLRSPEDAPLLKALANDPEVEVREEAAVSLAVLGDEAARNAILEDLRSSERPVRYRALDKLQRLKEAGQLAFALQTLEEFANAQTTAEDNREAARQLLGVSKEGR